MKPLTLQEQEHLDPDELLDYDTMTPDEQLAFAAGFRRGRRGPGAATAEQYSRKRAELAVKISQRDNIQNFNTALDRADKELGGPPA